MEQFVRFYTITIVTTKFKKVWSGILFVSLYLYRVFTLFHAQHEYNAGTSKKNEQQIQ